LGSKSSLYLVIETRAHVFLSSNMMRYIQYIFMRALTIYVIFKHTYLQDIRVLIPYDLISYVITQCNIFIWYFMV